MLSVTNDDDARASGRMYWQRRESANGPIEGGKAGPQSYCKDSTYPVIPVWRCIGQQRNDTNCNEDFMAGCVQVRSTVERKYAGQWIIDDHLP